MRHPGRAASMRWGINAFLVSLGALVALIALLFKSRPDPDRSPLFIYCAAGLKGPIEEIARDFEREYGVEIRLDYGGSGEQLQTAARTEKGDLYIPADLQYIKLARDKGLIDEEIPLAFMKPVVAVRKGNPKNVHTLDDLLRKDVTVVMANPEVAASGDLVRKALQKVQRWEPLRKKVIMKGTEPYTASDVRLGNADAGIIWDATVARFEDVLDPVELAELKDVKSSVTAAVLRSCEHPASALRFARYLSARDQGLTVFPRHGFVPIPDGDLWADGEPVIHMHAGAMLRPAIERTIRDFEGREGLPVGSIRINYNGCGILVSQMKAGERPDAFFACDAKYLDEPIEKEDREDEKKDEKKEEKKEDRPVKKVKKVRDLFLDSMEISTNKLVIMVHKGNPNQIHSIRDLTRKGMKVGVGHEHKCAMGALTAETFRQGRIKGKVHIVIEAATGDELVNKMQAAPDEMDAAVVYVSNYNRVKNKFDAIPIDLECAVAAQPIAAGKDSDHKYLVGRLIRAITSEESKKRFVENDFTWKATK